MIVIIKNLNSAFILCGFFFNVDDLGGVFFLYFLMFLLDTMGEMSAR